MLSTYFDVLRLFAATVVLLTHALPAMLGVDDRLIPGHEAVVLFFVLSGYVIGYVSDGRERDVRRYAVARVSRLYSVCLPAILFSVLVALSVPGTHWANVAGPAVVNLLFLGEWWTGTIYAPENGPFWSLNYEAWFYLIWGVWSFAGPRHRMLWTVAACALAGPRIVLLMPMWLLGIAVYRIRWRLSAPAAVLLIVVSVAGWIAIAGTGLRLTGQAWLRWWTSGYDYLLGPGTSVLTDYPMALFTAMQFAGVRALAEGKQVPATWARVVAAASSLTFGIYLFHAPMIELVHKLAGIGGAGGIGLVVLLSALAAAATERTRGAWRAAATRLLARTAPPVPG